MIAPGRLAPVRLSRRETLALLAALALGGVPGCQGSDGRPRAVGLAPLVGAIYYAWYDAEDWASGHVGRRLEPPVPPLRGEYASADPRVAAQHIAWASEYGIDAFVVSWSGSMSRQDRYLQAGPPAAPNVGDVRFALQYETLLALGHPDRGVHFDARAPQHARPTRLPSVPGRGRGLLGPAGPEADRALRGGHRLQHVRLAAHRAGGVRRAVGVPGRGARAVPALSAGRGRGRLIPRRMEPASGGAASSPAGSGTSGFRTWTRGCRSSCSRPSTSGTSQIEPARPGPDRGSTTAKQPYTQSFPHQGYGFRYLELLRDAVVAVSGRVVTAGSRPVPGAAGRVLRNGQGVARRYRDSAGGFRFARGLLPPGPYELTVDGRASGPVVHVGEAWSGPPVLEAVAPEAKEGKGARQAVGLEHRRSPGAGAPLGAGS